MTHTDHHQHHHRHHHGNVRIGRAVVAGGCLLVLLANGLLFREGSSRPQPLPILKLLSIVSLMWMYAGAWGMCSRMAWARALTLTILYAGSVALFLTGIITVTSGEGVMAGRLRPVWIATAIYLYVSLLLTHSKHVRRLTSRAYE
jgi:hypothetical protein